MMEKTIKIKMQELLERIESDILCLGDRGGTGHYEAAVREAADIVRFEIEKNAQGE
jgi:hypothetical protein